MLKRPSVAFLYKKYFTNHIYYLQSLCFTQIIKPTEVATSTLRKRTIESVNYLKSQSGKSSESLVKAHGALLQRSSKDERFSILKQIGLSGDVTDEQGLAMKADLNITWYTFRAWGR